MRNILPPGKTLEGKLLAFGKKLVEATWALTLSVWKHHNEAVHGKSKGYSDRDKNALRKSIETIYRELRNKVDEEDKWLFREEVRIRIDKPVPQQIAWLERVLISFDEKVRSKYSIITHTELILHRMCLSSIYV